MLISRNNYAGLAEPVGPYVQAVKHGDLLYLSGLTAFGTPAQDKPIADQVKAIFEQINTIATAEDASLENLIKVTLFVTELTDIQSLREALVNIYGDFLPASSLVQVNGLFDTALKIEVEALLAVPPC